MKTYLKMLAAICGMGLLLLTGGVFAKTPDGKTPAEEMVCDGESGAAFGLCNAYCEAMDCDSEDTRANQKACDRVKANYLKHKDPETTSLPCELAECPCWRDATEFFSDWNNYPPFINNGCTPIGLGQCTITTETESTIIDGAGGCGSSFLQATTCLRLRTDGTFELIPVTPQERTGCQRVLESLMCTPS